MTTYKYNAELNNIHLRKLLLYYKLYNFVNALAITCFKLK